MSAKVILHVDLDAFFAAVEQRDRPELRGRPVVIGADPRDGRGRGVVSTCSYEARRYGIHSAMPVSVAYQRCPRAVFLPPDMPKYRRVADQVVACFYSLTPDVEPVSIDEAFLDISGTGRLWGTPRQAGQLVRQRVRDAVGLTASVGIAPNKMVAKIASDYGKPDGLVEVTEPGLLAFLWPLTVDQIGRAHV